jgi:RHS repeat-associated protein
VATHIDSATIVLFTVAYDANGNTLSDPSGKQYTWDFENRLVQAVVPGTNGGTTTFKYDPFGRRIQKSGPLGTTNYLYDGVSDIEELDGSGNILGRYTEGRTIDEPLAELRSGSTSFYEQDGLGSVASLSNGTGAIIGTYTYDSFGNLTASTGTTSNPFLYTGRDFDNETNLQYSRARYYDPRAGRFLNEDPIRFGSGQNNFFVYVSNRPADLVDPSGLLQVCCRPAHNGPAAAWAFLHLAPAPCHCFLKQSSGHTLGGYHNYSLPGTLGGLVLRRDDNNDLNKYANEATCTNVGGSDCDRRAENAFNGLPPRLGGYGFGTNDYGTSNDAAARILKDAGIGYTLPACAWGKGTGTIPSGPIFLPVPIGPIVF